VYYVSLKGVTGSGNLDLSAIEEKMPQLRKHIKLPIGVGFGIRDAATAKAVARLCDGVVVGSRIVQEIEDSTGQNAVENVVRLVKELRQAVDQAWTK
jgi:tryptophan synthase alpha chain